MLSDVFTQVQANLTAAGITSPFLVGRRHLAEKGTGGNRIVVIPNEDTFGAGRTQDFNSKTGPGMQAARITRVCGAEVHVWGVPTSPTSLTRDVESMAAAEALLHAFVLQLRAVVRGQWSVASGRWNNETKDVSYGQEYVLQITVDVPVVDAFLPPLPVGTAIATTATVAPGNSPEVVQ
jgi:hypothetical protein